MDNKDRFVFSPLLYELATGRAEDGEVAPFYAKLLQDTDINHVKGRVLDVNLKNGSVQLEEGGDTLKYDHLVVALGSESTHNSDIDGVKEFCIPFYTVYINSICHWSIHTLLSLLSCTAYYRWTMLSSCVMN